MKHTFYIYRFQSVIEVVFKNDGDNWIGDLLSYTVYSKPLDGKIIADYNLNKKLHKYSAERLYLYLSWHFADEIRQSIADDIYYNRNQTINK
jgi:hypothetical protein